MLLLLLLLLLLLQWRWAPRHTGGRARERSKRVPARARAAAGERGGVGGRCGAQVAVRLQQPRLLRADLLDRIRFHATEALALERNLLFQCSFSVNVRHSATVC